MSSSLAEEKEPLINAVFGPQISTDQRFILLVKVAYAKLHGVKSLLLTQSSILVISFQDELSLETRTQSGDIQEVK